jgi:hypothetical protein
MVYPGKHEIFELKFPNYDIETFKKKLQKIVRSVKFSKMYVGLALTFLMLCLLYFIESIIINQIISIIMCTHRNFLYILF